METKKNIDLNCDLGESYGKHTSLYDAEIMPYLSSCNIACGFHSGDPLTIERTIKMALEQGVAIGAHPAFPDLQGFGRRRMLMPAEELTAVVRYQVAALKGMVEALGGQLHHVKLHGALYNLAAKDETTAQACLTAIKSIDEKLKVYGLSGSVMGDIATKSGLSFVHEVFADRAYEADASLRSRQLEGAVLVDEKQVLQQVKMMVQQGQVMSHNGQTLAIQADTLCLHSDTPGSARLAQLIRNWSHSVF